MKQLSEAQLELIKKPLDPKAVSKHPSKSYLSTIKPVYITERFNEVFGEPDAILLEEYQEEDHEEFQHEM